LVDRWLSRVTSRAQSAGVRPTEWPRVSECQLRGNPLTLRMAVLACRWELCVRRVEGELALGLVAVDALLLPHHARFVGRRRGGTASRDGQGGQQGEGLGLEKSPPLDNPHGLYDTLVSALGHV